MTFGGDVDTSDIRDWFDRAGAAVTMLYSGISNVSSRMDVIKPNFSTKFAAVKLLKSLVPVNLKQAMDAVELQHDSMLCAFESTIDAYVAAQAFDRLGWTVTVTVTDADDRTLNILKKIGQEFLSRKNVALCIT